MPECIHLFPWCVVTLSLLIMSVIGLFYQPWIDQYGTLSRMRISMGNKVLGANLPQCHFVHHKPPPPPIL
jgi:hypothetical protein